MIDSGVTGDDRGSETDREGDNLSLMTGSCHHALSWILGDKELVPSFLQTRDSRTRHGAAAQSPRTPVTPHGVLQETMR